MGIESGNNPASAAPASIATAAGAKPGERPPARGPDDRSESAAGHGAPTAPLNAADLLEEGFTSPVPWRDTPADCLVIACSDQRFQPQTGDFVRRLGFDNPHVIQFPAGLAAAHPLISAFGFLSKAVDKLLEKAIEATGAREILCIAHEDCAAYRLENVKFLDTTLRKVSGKSVRDLQIDHLRKAARRLQLSLRGTTVRTFFADLDETGAEPRVTFKEIPLDSKQRK